MAVTVFYLPNRCVCTFHIVELILFPDFLSPGSFLNISFVSYIFDNMSEINCEILHQYTDQKNFIIFNEIQKGAVGKSYMNNGLLIYD
jgi:hypothetical protein